MHRRGVGCHVAKRLEAAWSLVLGGGHAGTVASADMYSHVRGADASCTAIWWPSMTACDRMIMSTATRRSSWQLAQFAWVPRHTVHEVLIKVNCRRDA